MKPFRHLLADARRHQGLALIIVLSMLALATIVILAFLSVADTEHKATVTYSSSQSARRMADTAVNMVISQIRSGSERQTPNVPVIHATQPGAVRKYAQSGAFLAGYKLFSDRDMIYLAGGTGSDVNAAERRFVAESEPPTGWNQGNNIARYVDLNEPVIKGVSGDGGASTSVQVYFPVIDPRAGQDIDPSEGDDVPVEGFSYETNTVLNPTNDLSLPADPDSPAPIIKPGTAGKGLNDLRLAMPVQWLYVLKDGAIGYLDDNLRFMVMNDSRDGLGGAGANLSATPDDVYGIPSETNPIIGRVAFWADDETCKVNINTASEPTYSGQPIYYHERDHRWADYPPARAEYQRFPGHPATVALSSVLFPNPLQADNRSLDTYGLRGPVSGGNLNRALQVKERLYELMPRIHTGGSVAGTRTFERDKYDSAGTARSDAVQIEEAIGERLYASVDELLFSQTVNGGRRVMNNALVDSTTLFNRDSLERSSAFLTAHSRGSELTMFGLPRIAMWPVAESPSKRTGFDNLIEFCSRVGGADNAYIFKRAISRSTRGGPEGADYDINRPRNLALLNMLDQVLNKPFPSQSENAGASGSFRDKLGTDNARQLIVSIYDYIRCTNLYDSFLVPQNRNNWPISSINWTTLYNTRDNSEASFRTYTPGVVRNQSNTGNPYEDRFFPGHGQVTPAKHPNWTTSVGGKNIRGFGRFVSVSEIGLHFICTADGKPDMYSWRTPLYNLEQTPGAPPQYHFPDIEDGIISDPRNPDYNLDLFVDGNAAGNPGYISGGRTALMVDEANYGDSFNIAHDFPVGFNGAERVLTNIDAIHWRNPDAKGKPAVGVIKRRFYSNFPPLSRPDEAGFYNTIQTDAGDPKFAGLVYSRHPGYNPENWNLTLDRDSPLPPTKKRIQAMLHLELFCPSVGYTEINPDYTIVIDGDDVSNIEVNGRGVFSTSGPLVIKSERPLFETDNTPEVGGYASFRKIALDRRVKSVAPMPEDGGYDTSATAQVHNGLLNLDLISSFFDADRDKPLEFEGRKPIKIKIYDSHDINNREPVQIINVRFEKGRAPTPDLITQGSFLVDYVNGSGARVIHPAIQGPRWWSFSRDGSIGRTDRGLGLLDVEDARIYPPSKRGRLFRMAMSNSSETRAKGFGELQRVPGGRATIYGRDAVNFQDVYLFAADERLANPRLEVSYGPREGVSGWPTGEGAWDRPWHMGTDVLRTVAPAHGDARLIAVKYEVPLTDWTPHRLWDSTTEFMAHNFSSYTSGSEPGYDRGTSTMSTVDDKGSRGLPPAVTIGGGFDPDIPRGRSPYASTARAAHEFFQRYYDFDDSDPGGRVGPFINKVDEGNYAVGDYNPGNWPQAVKWRATYFRSGQGARFANGSGSFFTPNRMVPSPVVLGSLPSRVWDANGEGAWTNLLFRPHVQMPSSVTWRGYVAPPGGGQPAISSEATHPGQLTPPDHYLLDLFWMPTVEPYAISESLSTAGKINMNYQMLPFTHIRRATALHAAMKGELMAALPNPDGQNSKEVRLSWGLNGSTAPVFRSEADNKYWHRGIVVDRFKPNAGADRRWWELTLAERVQGTLRQFEERFNMDAAASSTLRGGLFRSASQICEVHLIPSLVPTTGGSVNVTPSELLNYSNRNDAMGRFWGEHAATGDNTRERPYANLYAKLTTRSNTFRVHVRAQSIRKAVRSVAPDVFDPERDQMSGEFRGSFLLERYIDQADLVRAGSQVNYADGSDPFSKEPLESYYRFRVLESKRFAP